MKEWLDEAKAKGIPRGPVAATSSLTAEELKRGSVPAANCVAHKHSAKAKGLGLASPGAAATP